MALLLLDASVASLCGRAIDRTRCTRCARHGVEEVAFARGDHLVGPVGICWHQVGSTPLMAEAPIFRCNHDLNLLREERGGGKLRRSTRLNEEHHATTSTDQ